MRKLCFALLLLGGLLKSAWAVEPFTIEDIRVEGLQRISAGTVFNYLPVKVGDRLDDQTAAQAIRALFKTGFFADVRLERDDSVLVVVVDERPSVASITISGNKDIETEQLLEALKRVGLAEGRVFNRSILAQVEQELRRQYFANGKYAVKIDTQVTPMERNRVAVGLNIEEGQAAKIKEINIVGNSVFDDETLLDEFELTTPTMFSFYTKKDQYSKQKLSGDLEALRSYYLNRGYLNFKINSTQVSISPDKQSIYVTVNITEGEQFTVESVKLAGDLVVDPDELKELVQVGPGDTYSRRLVADTSSSIVSRLGDEGYAFANVNTVPELDEEAKKVSLTFFVDPGNRVYVRRINFYGNVRTSDHVLRREMRQVEGAWFSTQKVERSRERLERLGYFSQVNVETPAVPGTGDQVDVDFTVVERPSGNFLASIGYSQTGGVILSASVQQDNFLGTGKRLAVRVNDSDIGQGFSLSYTNPYYTVDGVSRGFTIASEETDASEANLADYTTDINELSVHYGIPINEYDRFRVSLGYRGTTLNETTYSPDEVVGFITENGDNFATIRLGASWSHDTRNRALLADRGLLHSLSGDVALPGGDLEFYKFRYRYQRYLPLGWDLTLMLKGEIAYGDGYGDTELLPFFENFFAGGPRSVRGYAANTLGPRDSRGNPLGGAFEVVGGAEVYFPVPFAKDARQFRLGAFVDIGNVFEDFDAFDSGELRYSTGISTLWLSPVGPLSLSFAVPLNDKAGDETEVVQFSLGGSFF